MTTRAEQRELTRERIVTAAVEAFADKGFQGASTRQIADLAGTNQGLITYHFQSKDELWRAAADRIFGQLRERLGEPLSDRTGSDPREFAREAIRVYVRFAAARPELFRLMVDEGIHQGDRMQWLVDTHLRPAYEQFIQVAVDGPIGFEAAIAPHAFYVLTGAGSLIFAVAPECNRLTGLDPASPDVVEAHADFVARLLVP